MFYNLLILLSEFSIKTAVSAGFRLLELSYQPEANGRFDL